MILQYLPSWFTPDTTKLVDAALRIVLTIGGAWALQQVGFFLIWRVERWLVRATHGGEHGAQRARTVAQTSRNFLTTLIVVAALIHILEILGWDVKPLLVGASILGAALGFGAQFLVRDVIAGAFILIEDQFTVGDRIEVNGTVATVEALTLRSTRLRDFQGRLLFVPNGEMKIIVNHSRGWHLAIVDLPLSANQDLTRAFTLAGEVAAGVNADPELKPLLLEPLRVVGLTGVSADAATLRLTARTVPGGEDAVAREARLAVLVALHGAGIRAASGPQLTLAPASTPPPAGASGI